MNMDSAAVPRHAEASEVAELDRADERISCLKALFGTTIGNNGDSFDWCPDSEPPETQEALGWLWFLKPKLNENLRGRATGNLRKLISAYEEHTLDDWWRQLLEQKKDI